MASVPPWVSRAAQEAAVMERDGLVTLYHLDPSQVFEVEATQAIIRLARGIRRKLEWWQKRAELEMVGATK